MTTKNVTDRIAERMDAEETFDAKELSIIEQAIREDRTEIRRHHAHVPSEENA